MTDAKKKIILIGPAYPYRGGNALFVTHTYEVLKDSFNVKVYNYKLLYPSLLFPGATQFDESEKKVFNIPGKRLVNSISPLNWFSVAKKLKNENADLIIFDWWHPFFGLCHGVISFLIRKFYSRKILFITENVVSHEANWFDLILTKIGLANASHFLVLSKKVEEELTRFSKGKLIYKSELPVYDCYQNENNMEDQTLRSELGIKKNNKVILFFGYVRKYKGLDILIQAFPKILSKHLDSTLLIVGEFYDKPEPYLGLIRKLNIQDNVRVVNKYVSNEEVSKYYLASDVVILPYKSATQSGILNVAYGFHKPVIVTDVGGLAEFVVDQKTGIVIKPNSAEEIANGYDRFLELTMREDFKMNILEHNRLNGFQNMPGLIREILDDNK
jgi:glycosyltransferase involved in cell wall biosynthesis